MTGATPNTRAGMERWERRGWSRIYVASSWRNELQPEVVRMLRVAGHEVYDFKNPREGDHGFHWTQVGMPSYDRATNSDVPVSEYLSGIQHPIAQAGFKSDFDAMKWADTCVLVLPCGRSAHLELGWFVGQGRRTAILLDGPNVTPELMYLMVDARLESTWDLLDWIGDASKPSPRCPRCHGWCEHAGGLVTCTPGDCGLPEPHTVADHNPLGEDVFNA